MKTRVIRTQTHINDSDFIRFEPIGTDRNK